VFRGSMNVEWTRRLFLGVSLLISVSLSSTAVGQVVSDDVSCEECRITLERQHTVGEMDDPLSLGFMDWKTAALSRTAALFVGPMYQPGSVSVFSPSGAYLTSYGRLGDGPGDLGRILTILADPKGGVSILQPGRISRIDEGGEIHLEGRLLTTVDDAEFLRNGNLVVAGSGGEKMTGFGQRLHEFDQDLRWLRSFDEEALGTQANTWDLFRILGSSPRGGLWVGRPNVYEVSYWEAGREARILRREADWFHAWTSQPAGSPFGRRPNPMVTDIIEDSEERLWVLISIAGPHWEPIPPPRLGDIRAVEGRIVSVIEVISLESGSLLAREMAPVNLKRFLAPGVAVSVEETADGLVRLVTWEMKLGSD